MTAVKETRIVGYLDEVATTVADVGRVLDIVPSRMAAAPAPRSARVVEVQPELSTLDSVKVDVSVDVGAARLDAPTLRAPDPAMRQRVEANIATSRAVREARIENRNAANSKRVLQNVAEQRKIRSARADSGWGGYKAREAEIQSVAIGSKRPPVHLTEGKSGELEILANRGIVDYKQQIFRPDSADINSDLFKEIVGKPKYTKNGLPRGTFPDYMDKYDLEEIKLGRGVLKNSYQIRLQVYLAKKDNLQYTLTTTRTIDSKLSEFLAKHNAIINKLE